MVPYAAVSQVRRGDSGSVVVSRSDGLAVVISANVLNSLEAGTLLADGLSTNPAVAPAAAQLLQSPLAAARSTAGIKDDPPPAPQHTVNRSGTTHTFYSMAGFHLFLGITVAVIGAGLLVGEAAALANPSSKWAQGGNSTWDYIGGAGLGVLLVWIGIRLLRVAVRISSEKITIRGYFVTRTVNASDIRAITLQPKDNGEGRLRWIPEVELTSGKSFSINSFDCGPARKPPKPELAATIEDIRALLGVEADDLSTPESDQADH
jgi:hypothetical protein